ncbi:hypothetical protein BJAS_P1187 [Bathymodiolus japonicus methanotrophic gill symbiont]|uniref:hypothetical protein n=2 Tax=Bathymodiolus japonicus methanotrophic gill symbiont TaxID=113269 RepID=UPI001B3E54A7|nr:hypothetical protein [Bathymodiolus japonicus methanotrophic gill symbiont]GFO71577.1 hypothetical protein BJAS_P1187 [Bathymodiolus japonicus methanotrophic gill symbiont]
MGDALNALRPQRLRTKAASSLLPHWLDGYSECNSCSSRVLLAHVESANCPVAYQGLKITTSLSYVSMIFSVSQLALQILCFLYKTLNFLEYFCRNVNYTQIMMIFLTKVNEFIDKNNITGTIKLSKKHH